MSGTLPPPNSSSPRPRPWLPKIFYASLVGLLCASVGSRLGRFHFSADWLALFVDLYFWLSLGMSLLLLFRKQWSWGILAVGLVVLNGSQLWGYTPRISTSRAAEGGELRIYVFNMYYRNADLEQMLSTIQEEDPDVVFLQEYSYDIQARIESQFAAYPHQLIEPSRLTMGVALFSKLPLEEARIHRFERTRIPIVEAVFDVNGRSARFVGGHPWPPLPQWGTLHRNQVADIERVASQNHPELPLIVAGDFNASPWSFVLRRLASNTGTTDAARGHGWQKSFELTSWFRLPLDHVYVGEEWEVVGLKYGARGGSDHQPLIVDLRFN